MTSDLHFLFTNALMTYLLEGKLRIISFILVCGNLRVVIVAKSREKYFVLCVFESSDQIQSHKSAVTYR